MENRRIPIRGKALDELERLEAEVHLQEVEGYDEARRCALTCKTCKSLACSELGE